MYKLHLDFIHSAYDIQITNDFALLKSEVEQLSPSKILIITDSNVSKLYLKMVYDALFDVCDTVASVEFTAGEKSKNLTTVQYLYEACVCNNLDRKSIIIALGGGVVGDMAGFVAASYMRGIRFVQIPTTLLSQTDSSVGGKVGVDFAGYKNIIGAFKQPSLVYINTDTLKTLPLREFACGMGEVIKYGAIADASFLTLLSENAVDIQALEPLIMKRIIAACCRMKADIVRKDEKENDLRAVLNFGHTIGHAIESALDFSLLHGECVAIGMMAALRISQKRGWVNADDVALLKKLLQRYNLPAVANDLDVTAVTANLKKDKKIEKDILKFVLVEPMGCAKVVTDVTQEELTDAIESVLA